MNEPHPAIAPVRQELAPLRQAIDRLAARCGLDLGERSTIRSLIAGDLAALPASDPLGCIELRTMLTLLYRLEDSSSEDIGIDGLLRLWRQHEEIMAAQAERRT